MPGVVRGSSPLALPRPGQHGTTAKLFRGLGDPTRLRILSLLEERERTVAELVQELGSPQGRVSSHLACLRWCGLVEVRREGRRAFYRLGDPRVRHMLALARSFLQDNAERIDLCRVIDAPDHSDPAVGGSSG